MKNVPKIVLKSSVRVILIVFGLSLAFSVGAKLETSKGFFTGADDAMMFFPQRILESISNDSFSYTLGLFVGFCSLLWLFSYSESRLNKDLLPETKDHESEE